jgi:hypothetical protein
MSVIDLLVTRETIVATAIAGALLATAGSLRTAHGRIGPIPSTALTKAGYALTGASVLLLIVAGFLSGR